VMTELKVDLFWLWRNDLLGLIIPAKTGVFFSNQTDGVACNHPKLEGVFVPLQGEHWDDKKGERVKLSERRFWVGGSDELRFEDVIKEFGLPLKPLPFQFQEAWVWCKVTRLKKRSKKDVNGDDWTWLCGQPRSFWTALEGKEVLLTFQNSD
jgi:hypothetical protein